jgi:hypothetical protein
MRKFSIACLGLLLLSLPASRPGTAQSSVPAWPNGSADVNEGWRAQSGDNLDWAQPGFDDSAWRVVALTSANDNTGWRWDRLRITIPHADTPLALLITGGRGTFEVYINGERVPGPQLLPDRFVTWPRTQVVPLPAVAGNAVIALRTRIPATSMFLADRGSLRVALGTLPAIRETHNADFGTRFERLAPGIGIYLLVLFAGIPLLALFWYQPEHREYLWLGCYLLVDAFGALSYDLATAGLVPFSLNWAISVPANYFIAFFQIQFTFSFVGQRVTRDWRIYQLLIFAYPACFAIPSWLGYFSRGTFDVGEIAVIVPTALVLPFLLLYWYRRGNREAGWLILPSLLPLVTISAADVGIVGGYFDLPRLAFLEHTIPLGPFAVQSFELADLLFLLAIGVVMFFRFTRVSREQAHSAAELQAARELQQRLVPASLPSVPGYALRAAYLPAEEVGGDFYQVFPQADGDTLAIIGDVSGKGLKAAMTGALVLGALRSLAQENLTPAPVLTRLNAQLLASSDGGFVTCLCVRIAPDGVLTLANAGHLAPYLSGEEISLDSGLPLGIAADAVYNETALQLAPGETLTFLSDGVVEAQSPTGELFGFERTAAISIQTAEEIARAASTHGQQDDITVLTLTFAPASALAGVVHA